MNYERSFQSVSSGLTVGQFKMAYLLEDVKRNKLYTSLTTEQIKLWIPDGSGAGGGSIDFADDALLGEVVRKAKQKNDGE